MKFTIQLLIEDANCMPLSIPVTTIDRACDAVEDVGLHLEEAKAVLGRLQEIQLRRRVRRQNRIERTESGLGRAPLTVARVPARTPQ